MLPGEILSALEYLTTVRRGADLIGNEAKGVSSLDAQAAGQGIGAIIQFLDGLPDPLADRLANVGCVVDDARDGFDRNTCGFRYVFDRGHYPQQT